MTEFFEFLNHQSGDRLAGYGMLFLVALYIVFRSLVEIITAFKKGK